MLVTIANLRRIRLSRNLRECQRSLGLTHLALVVLISQINPLGAAENGAPERVRLDSTHYLQGKFVYERNCQICHGRLGDGNGPWAATLEPKPRSFRLANFKYRTTAYDKLPTNHDLEKTIREGRSNTAMGMFTKLSEKEVEAVISYLKFFSPKWKYAHNYGEPVPLPKRPDWHQVPDERHKHIKKGRELFLMACAPCHGEKGDGAGIAANSLRDAQDRPIKPTDLRNPLLRSGRTDTDLLRVLMTGISGTPMMSFAETLSAQELWEIVTYLEVLRSESD